MKSVPKECLIGSQPIFIQLEARKPEWRNWQTRQVEGLVPVMGVQVQVLSPAINQGNGLWRMPTVALVLSKLTW